MLTAIQSGTALGAAFEAEENIRLATAGATQRGLAGQISFQLGDAERLPFGEEAFDAVICEFAFCTFPSKPVAAKELLRVLKPGGQLGFSDLTRTEKTPPGLKGQLSWIAFIGDALPADRYVEILNLAGFEVANIEDHNDSLVDIFLRPEIISAPSSLAWICRTISIFRKWICPLESSLPRPPFKLHVTALSAMF